MRTVTPSGSTLLTMPGLLLPPLPDIEDYVPPPFTEVVKVGTAKCCRPWKTLCLSDDCEWRQAYTSHPIILTCPRFLLAKIYGGSKMV